MFTNSILSVTAEWYAKQDPDRFTFHIGETVISIDTEEHTVTTDKGRTIAYDYYVLATGSEATLPSYANTSVPGVFVYRNIADMNKLLAYAEKEGVKGESVSPGFDAHGRHSFTLSY